MNRLQLTLALLKPDVTINEIAKNEILKLILDNKFFIIRSKCVKLSLNEAKEFYKVHKEKFFYNRLIYSMSSGITQCHILAKENAIADWRLLMGPTKVFKTIYDKPDTIRGKFGTTDTRNATHGSDSVENAKQEIKFFFPEFNYDKWFQTQEELYRMPSDQKIKYNVITQEHEILK